MAIRQASLAKAIATALVAAIPTCIVDVVADAGPIVHAPFLPLDLPVGTIAKAPNGWIDFCLRHAPDCDVKASEPRDITLTADVWTSIVDANTWVNAHVMPLSDKIHWGVADRWDYPDDGFGDCEDYALLKRRMLMQAGLPREALLITLVWDKKGVGHAVLTVRTDRGEFILDNMRADVLLWWETGYDFVKRQSQTDPNVWVYFEGFNRAAPQAVAAASAPPQNSSTPSSDPGQHLAGRSPR